MRPAVDDDVVRVLIYISEMLATGRFTTFQTHSTKGVSSPIRAARGESAGVDPSFGAESLRPSDGEIRHDAIVKRPSFRGSPQEERWLFSLLCTPVHSSLSLVAGRRRHDGPRRAPRLLIASVVETGARTASPHWQYAVRRRQCSLTSIDLAPRRRMLSAPSASQ